MLSIGNKKYRNLQEQVGYNTECIKKIDEYLDGITIDDKLVVIESDSGIFTNEELVRLSAPLAFISNGSKVWIKEDDSFAEIVFKAIDITANATEDLYLILGGSKIVVNKNTGEYVTSLDPIMETYSKSRIDSLIASIAANKADKNELNIGLAKKADIAGQAFTGAITAPSIIEDMSGYLFSQTSRYASEISLDFAGAVKNGNKLTLAISGSVTPLTGGNVLTDGIATIGNFSIPQEVANVLFPYKNTDILSYQQILFASDANANIIKNAIIQKDSRNINFKFYSGGMIANTKYYFRSEITFLLNDNLIS